MEELQYHRDHKFNSRNLLRVGDLIYFEGPMLTLFVQSGTGYFYLFDWVDRDRFANRGLVYRVDAKDLNEYILGRISHYELFIRNPDGKTYFVDIDQRNKPFYHYNFYLLDSIPEHYLPLQENYFDVNDCPASKRIISVINSSLNHPFLNNVFHNRSLAMFSETASRRVIVSFKKKRQPLSPSIKKYSKVRVNPRFRRKNLSLNKN